MTKKLLLISSFVLLTSCFSGLYAQKLKGNKKAVEASIENHKQELIALSDSVWACLL